MRDRRHHEDDMGRLKSRDDERRRCQEMRVREERHRYKDDRTRRDNRDDDRGHHHRSDGHQRRPHHVHKPDRSPHRGSGRILYADEVEYPDSEIEDLRPRRGRRQLEGINDRDREGYGAMVRRLITLNAHSVYIKA